MDRNRREGKAKQMVNADHGSMECTQKGEGGGGGRGAGVREVRSRETCL